MSEHFLQVLLLKSMFNVMLPLNTCLHVCGVHLLKRSLVFRGGFQATKQQSTPCHWLEVPYLIRVLGSYVWMAVVPPHEVSIQCILVVWF